MRLKRMIAALAACLALGAVAANMAQAEGTCWTIKGSCVPVGKSETVKIEKHTGSTLSLTGELLGKKLTLTATAVECAAGATCTVDNTVSPNHGTAVVGFTGVVAAEPANCTVHSPGKANGTVVADMVTDTVIMDPKGGTAGDQKWDTVILVEFTGEKCVFNELEVPIEGSITGRMVHSEDVASKTGEQFVTQSLLFNKAEQETGGGKLTIGEAGNVAFLDGTVDLTLSGANLGNVWGSV